MQYLSLYFIGKSHNRPINIFNDLLNYNVTFDRCILVFLSTRLSVTINENKNYRSTEHVRVPYVKYLYAGRQAYCEIMQDI